MDRLVVLHLEAVGCTAEAWLNGVPLARVEGKTAEVAPGVAPGTAPAAQPGTAASVNLPVHEFTLAGNNELALVLHPGPPGASPSPEPRLSDGQCGASLRLLLPRMDSVAHPANARTLAQLDWAPAADAVYEAPLTLRKTVELQIAFPRWRWLDAPVIADPAALKKDLAAYLLDIAIGLAKGNAEPLIQASRLRLEELAQAYQRNLADDVARLRQHIAQLHAAQPLKPTLPGAGGLLLRPVAGGRMLECLAADGTPLLQSPLANGGRIAWPLRVAVVEGRFYVLR